MAPRRPSAKKGERRLDAALDAMSPYGFPTKLVRRTVQKLLKVYGGTDGWVFIEDSAYTLLIETLLEAHATTLSSPQDGMTEDNPEYGHNEAAPAGCSDRALLPCSNTEISDDASTTNQAVDNLSAVTELCHLPLKAVATVSATSETNDQLSIKPVDTVPAATESGNQVTFKAGDIVLATDETCNQLPIKAADNESDEPAGSLALGEIHRGTLVASPQPVERLVPQRRRPCYGWISDDDEEGELIELPPAPLSKLKYYLC